MATATPGLIGWFGPTDRKWFDFLRARPDLDEVNFWVPSGRLPFRQAVPIGSPFFFKLKSPYNAVGGFGYLAHVSTLPILLAWEAFGEKNGTPDYESLVRSIVHYRNKEASGKDRPDVDPPIHHHKMEIGCLMVSQPVFFADTDLVPQPRDWPSTAVRGKSLSLTEGEGLRIWAECRARAGAGSGVLQASDATIPVGKRFGEPLLVTPRLGQGTFRVALLDAYNRQCAVTTEHSLPVLDAAHIRPYAKGGEHALSNGLVLRTDIHRLYDLGYVAVDPQGRFRVSRRLRQDWENGRVYYELEGRELTTPPEESRKPDPRALEWHMDEVFLGE